MSQTKIRISSKDGVVIPAVASKIDDKSVRGVVIVVHGFGEYAKILV